MKKYKIAILVLIIIALVSGIGFFVIRKVNLSHEKRSNTECTTDQRIFDYQDVLTDSDESQLQKVIDECENKVGMDIVIVTCGNNNDFSDVMGSDYDYYVNSYVEYDYVKHLAASFNEYYKFGWEGTLGNSIVVVADFDKGDAWMCTTGKAKEKISDSTASDIVNNGCEYLRNDPLKAFTKIIEQSSQKMCAGSGIFTGIAEMLNPFFCILGAMLITVIFFCINFSKKAGKKTTDCATYAAGGNSQELDRRDIFINKTVTSVAINTSSGGSSGGGGGGGGSHGGGGGHF